MKIIDVSAAHLPKIEEIEKLSFSLPWSYSQLERQMLGENNIFLVAENENGDILGYVGMMFVLDEGYISNIAVAPGFRRRGVADALITELKLRCEKAKLSFLTLEVRESNYPAIALYSKHGFAAVGVRTNYYEKPRENALLMTKFFA